VAAEEPVLRRVAVFDGEVAAAAIECHWSESNGTGPCIVGRYGELLANPLGIDAARLLVDARQVEPLRRVLRGANPEGRGLAAVGLSSLGALSTDDVIMINRLKDTYQVLTTNGCFMREWTGKEFFSDLKAHAYLFNYPRRSRPRW
jgi:hypothetical protein